MRILVIEDNRRFSESLVKSLEEDGYAVDAVFDGDSGENMGISYSYDLIVLDIMLPEKNGFEVCRSLRLNHVATPILMLTARGAVGDRVKGLDGGADDYLTKPFELAELKARLRALLRRNSSDKASELRIADLVLDPATHLVRRGGHEIGLTAREFSLLEYFLRHQVWSNASMAEGHLWNQDENIASMSVDVYVPASGRRSTSTSSQNCSRRFGAAVIV